MHNFCRDEHKVHVFAGSEWLPTLSPGLGGGGCCDKKCVYPRIVEVAAAAGWWRAEADGGSAGGGFGIVMFVSSHFLAVAMCLTCLCVAVVCARRTLCVVRPRPDQPHHALHFPAFFRSGGVGTH